MLVIPVEQIEYFKEGLFISFRKLLLPCRGPPKCFAVLLRDAPEYKMVRRHVTTNRPGHRLDCFSTERAVLLQLSGMLLRFDPEAYFAHDESPHKVEVKC